MKIGDKVFVRGYIDEIRKDTIIIRNEGGYFGTVKSEIIEAEPQWIPVSERLPEEKGLYVVTDSKGDVVRFVFEDTEMSREYWKRCAKAWMPSPKPYEEDNEWKMDEAFHVGDEVQHVLEDGRIMKPRFVITSISYDGSLNGIGKDGIAFCDKNPARWCKTGRHFVEAEKLMKALEADYDSD